MAASTKTAKASSASTAAPKVTYKGMYTIQLKPPHETRGAGRRGNTNPPKIIDCVNESIEFHNLNKTFTNIHRHDQICYRYFKGKKWFFVCILYIPYTCTPLFFFLNDPIDTNKTNQFSRQAIKKYVQANNDVKAVNFDALFNAALRRGVESGDFLQPKGPSGPVKLAKKDKPATTKVVKKAATASTTTKAAPKKVTKKAAEKPAKVTKKAATTTAAAPKKKAAASTKKAATTAAPKKKAATTKKTTKKATK